MKDIALMEGDDYLTQEWYNPDQGPPFTHFYKAVIPYARLHQELELAGYCGTSGWIVIMRREQTEHESVDDTMNIIEANNPPDFWRHVYRLYIHPNSTRENNIPYSNYSFAYNRSVSFRCQDEWWWTNDTTTPEDGYWIWYYSVFAQTIMLSYKRKLLYPNGSFAGLIFSEFSIAGFSDVLERAQAEMDTVGQLFIMDRRGNLLGSGTGEVTGRLTLQRLKHVSNSTSRTTRDVGVYLLEGNRALGGIMHARIKGTQYVVATHVFCFGKPPCPAHPHLHEAGQCWVLAVVVPRSAYFARVDAGLIASVVIAAVFVALAAFVVVLVTLTSRRIGCLVRQIDHVSQHCSISAGVDLAATPSLGTAGTFPVLEVTRMQDDMDRIRTILRSFEKYVPVPLLRSLIQSNRPATLELHPTDATVMFIDIWGFTSIVEKTPLGRVIDQFTEYVNCVTELIAENHGTLDKFMGDGVMAFFGCPPSPLEDHRSWACRCALQIQASLVELREHWIRKDGPLFYARIGIASGVVRVGNMGAAERFQYTVLGNVVNTAARMEGLNKHFGTQVLLTGDTWDGMERNPFAARYLGAVRVKGKQAANAVYELVTLGRAGEREEASIASSCNEFSRAMRAFEAREFESAIAFLERFLAADPEALRRQLLHSLHPQLTTLDEQDDRAPDRGRLVEHASLFLEECTACLAAAQQGIALPPRRVTRRCAAAMDSHGGNDFLQNGNPNERKALPISPWSPSLVMVSK
eukprot:gnl/Trimastix_PCT/2762.p1 GENE.gnl/Trimastix_PCT/2762~~gnl/Trimastix_PCT/2762.p1  ORF type:complete len:840 (-),score=187.74 gnl/Trimastix_PCT/2762:43-2283(-)